MILNNNIHQQLDKTLAATDALLANAYPGDTGSRQAVHTVYVPADQFTFDSAQRWGQQALGSVQQQGSMRQLVDLVLDQDSDDEYRDKLAVLVERKLTVEPVEDLRIDFEDGYGRRSDADEDRHAMAAGQQVAKSLTEGTAPPFIGIRFKCLEADLRARGLRTLEIYLSTLLEQTGQLPDAAVLTLPKVTTLDQIKAMNVVAEALEAGFGLPHGALRYEVQVETPQLIVSAEGRSEVARLVHAGEGRVTSLHYGTYDYSASLGIAAAYQSMDHPAADFAKNVILAAVADTGVHFSDGSTNILPVGSPAEVREAWKNHARLVGRHLHRGIYQGWDMHPAHLPTRFLTTFDFFNRSLYSAVRRLDSYIRAETSGVMDEPATAKALARYILRSTECGAADSAEMQQLIGLDQLALQHLASTGLIPESAL